MDAFLEIIPDGNMDLQTFKDQIEQDIADEEPAITKNKPAAENAEARPDKSCTSVEEDADTSRGDAEASDDLADLLGSLKVSKPANKVPA